MSCYCTEMHFPIGAIRLLLMSPLRSLSVSQTWLIIFLLVNPFSLQHITLCLQAKCSTLYIGSSWFSSPKLWAPWGQGTHLPHLCSAGRAPTQFNTHLQSSIMSWAIIQPYVKIKLIYGFSPWSLSSLHLFSITERDITSPSLLGR